MRSLLLAILIFGTSQLFGDTFTGGAAAGGGNAQFDITGQTFSALYVADDGLGTLFSCLGGTTCGVGFSVNAPGDGPGGANPPEPPNCTPDGLCLVNAVVNVGFELDVPGNVVVHAPFTTQYSITDVIATVTGELEYTNPSRDIFLYGVGTGTVNGYFDLTGNGQTIFIANQTSPFEFTGTTDVPELSTSFLSLSGLLMLTIPLKRYVV